MLHNKKGFTLIEMLVVIAIVAVLVSVVIPVVGQSTTRARAAADAANLRATYGSLNSIITQQGDPGEFAANFDAPESLYVEGSEMHILYTYPGFIKIYYVKDGAYYGLEYFSAIAEGLPTDDISLDPPTDAGVWYRPGYGAITED